MSWMPDKTPVAHTCSYLGCTATFGRSRWDSYYSRPLPDGWLSVIPGYRCEAHHDFEISFEQAIEAVSSDHYAAENEFGSHQGSDEDWDAVLRALRRSQERESERSDD